MADPKKILGGLGKIKQRLLAPKAPDATYADPLAPPSMRMSEALGNAGAEGKTLNFTEADRSRVFGKNRGGVGFAGLQQYSLPHKQANTVWGFGNTATAEKKIRQNDPENSLWTTFVGSPTQHRSNSVVIGDAIKEFQKSVKQGVVPREQIMLMNKRLNEITDQKTGAKIFEDGFDLTDPSALNVANTFSRRAAVGDVMLGLGVKGPMARLEFKKEYPNTKFTDGSNIENILKRETDPDLMDAGTYDVGNRLFVMDGKIIERPDLNEAFPKQVTGTDLGMKYELVPPERAMRDFYKAREGRKNKHGEPSPVTYYDLARAEPSQLVDEDYLTFLQKAGDKKGGAVNLEDADRRLAVAIQQRMAKGGKVSLEASDAKLRAAIQARMAKGGQVGFKKIEFMDKGGKVGKIAKGIASVGKRLLADPVLPTAERDANLAKFLAESKVKNKLYHGTTKDIQKFDPSQAGKKTGNLTTALGTFLSDSPKEASRYAKDWGSEGGNVMPVFAQLKNPYEMPYPEFSDLAMGAWNRRMKDPDYDPNSVVKANDMDAQRRAAQAVNKHEADALQDVMSRRDELMSQGYDSVMVKIGGNNEIIVFDPAKIKSATGNRGTYDLTDPDINKAEGGPAFKKLEFMADGGKLVKGLGKIGKRLLSQEQETSQAIGKAAESAGMNAPVTANKPLTNLQDFHTSLGDAVQNRAAEMQNMVESMPFKYDKGQRVFTEGSAAKNKPPYTILYRLPFGNQPMYDRTSNFPKVVKDPETGKTVRTPYEPGYRVRYEDGDEWSQFDIPESAIKGNVDMARGGLAYMDKGGKAGKVVSGLDKVRKRLLGTQDLLPAAERDVNLAKFLEGNKAPPTVYHSTSKDFNQFSPKKLGQNTKHPTTKLGFFTAADPASTEDFISSTSGVSKGLYESGANIMPLHVSIKNPYEIPSTKYLLQSMALQNIKKKDADKYVQDFVDSLKAEGHDGLLIKANPKGLAGGNEFTSDNWVAFEPTQIKSAIGNRGTYDINEPDITKARGGLAMADGGDSGGGGSGNEGGYEGGDYGGGEADSAYYVDGVYYSNDDVAGIIQANVDQGISYDDTLAGASAVFGVPLSQLQNLIGPSPTDERNFVTPVEEGSTGYPDYVAPYPPTGDAPEVGYPVDLPTPEEKHSTPYPDYIAPQQPYPDYHSPEPYLPTPYPDYYAPEPYLPPPLPDVRGGEPPIDTDDAYPDFYKTSRPDALEKELAMLSGPLDESAPYSEDRTAPLLGPLSEATYSDGVGNYSNEDIASIIQQNLDQGVSLKDTLVGASAVFGIPIRLLQNILNSQPIKARGGLGMAEGGGAFKKLQFMDKGGVTTSAGSFSPEELGVTANDLRLIDEKTLNNIKNNAPATYEWIKQNIKDEANQLKSARGMKDFALRVGASYAGGIPDLLNLGAMGVDLVQSAIPSISKPESVLDVAGSKDRIPKFKLASDKPYFGSEQYIDAMHKAGLLGENQFPVAEGVAGVLMPAGLIKKGIKKGAQLFSGKKPEETKKRRGGLAAMAR